MDKAVLKIREMMRDRQSHDTYFSSDETEYIEVVMPEMVRADPQKEAEKIRIRENIGETDKILNDLQKMRNKESKNGHMAEIVRRIDVVIGEVSALKSEMEKLV